MKILGSQRWLKTFSVVFFAHPIAQVFRSLKPKGCAFESRRRRNYFIFLISLFIFKIQLKVVTKFTYMFANSLDFGDFRQIILYFGLSTCTHIEYRIKVVR